MGYKVKLPSSVKLYAKDGNGLFKSKKDEEKILDILCPI